MDLLEQFYRPTEAAEEVRSRANIARALMDARLNLGLTQAKVGELAGTKQSRVSEIESFKGNPRLSTLDRIARAVGLMVTLVPRLSMVGSSDLSTKAVIWHHFGARAYADAVPVAAAKVLDAA
jgi:transcriptional regulator with XRE-family HTH domain